MALNNDIKQAFETSVGGESTNLTNLSNGLANAIGKYIGELNFRVEDLTAQTVLPPGAIQTPMGFNLNPVPITVTVSLTKPKGLTDQPNALVSSVKVDPIENNNKSGVQIV